MRAYAEGTSVPVEKSAAEIEGMVRKYGATAFARHWENARASVQFAMAGRIVRFELSIPTSQADLGKTPTGRRRKATTSSVEQETRRRWRALALLIKAKLEAVHGNSGIQTFEREFLAYIVTESGRTIGEVVVPKMLDSEGEFSAERPKLLKA